MKAALLAWCGSLDLRTVVVSGISKSHCTDGRVRHIGRSFIRMRNKPGPRIERERERGEREREREERGGRRDERERGRERERERRERERERERESTLSQ